MTYNSNSNDVSVINTTFIKSMLAHWLPITSLSDQKERKVVHVCTCHTTHFSNTIIYSNTSECKERKWFLFAVLSIIYYFLSLFSSYMFDTFFSIVNLYLLYQMVTTGSIKVIKQINIVLNETCVHQFNCLLQYTSNISSDWSY